jgi:hypothetical protein
MRIELIEQLEKHFLEGSGAKTIMRKGVLSYI